MDLPRSLYAHVPFCSRVCPYCAFAVTASFDDDLVRRFIEALDREIRELDGGRPLALSTIYVGGGTPTVLEARPLSRLLESIKSRCVTSVVQEWTVELNPENADLEKARLLLQAGVTRVSVGAQSMNDDLLKKLGRTHSADQVRQSIRILKEAGFSDLNVDLIYAQPGQTLSDWVSDVEAVLDLGVTHLSLYELTFEPGTPFGRARDRGSMARTEDSVAVAMFWAARDRLADAGIEWYEISNFAVPGRESRHNQTYWRNEPYFGVGPGAFACVHGTRTTNAADVADWARRVESAGTGVVDREVLGNRETFIETLAAGLRTREGIDTEALLRRTQIDVRETHRALLDELCAKGLAIREPDRLKLSLPGVLLLDSILLRFLDLSEGAGMPAGGAA